MPASLLLKIMKKYTDTLNFVTVFQVTQNCKLDAVKRLSKKREESVFKMVVWMNVSFLVCWMPYAVIAICYIFGKELSTMVIALPLMTAKSSVCWNPILYIAMNRQVSNFCEGASTKDIQYLGRQVGFQKSDITMLKNL